MRCRYVLARVANGIVYVGSYDDKVYALNATTGFLDWSYATGDPVDSSPAVANGAVYVGGLDDNLYTFDLTGGMNSAMHRPNPARLRPNLHLTPKR